MSETNSIMGTNPSGGALIDPPSALLDSHLEKKVKDVNVLAGGVGTNLAGKFVGRGLRMVVDILLAHMFGPINFGLYSIGWTILRVMSLVSPLGLSLGVVRYGSQYWRNDEGRLKGVVLESVGLAFLSGLLMGGGLYWAAPWLSEQIFRKPDLTPVIHRFAVVLPLLTAMTVAAAATRVSQRMKSSVYIEDVCQPASCVLLITVFFLLGRGFMGALEAIVGSFAVALILALYFIKRLFQRTASQVRPIFPGKELLGFCLPASLATTYVVLLYFVDRLVVGHFLSAAEAGIYYLASQLSVTFAIILGTFAAIFSPMTADLYHKGEIRRLEELFRVSTKWSFYLSLSPFLVMCFAPREIMTVLFGAPYAAGWLALVILAAGQLVNAGTGAVGALLVMTGHQNTWLKLSAVIFFANVVLVCALVPRWGLPGAALGTALAISVLFFVGLLKIRKSLGIWPYDRRYLKGLLAAGLAAGALAALHMLRIGSPALNLSVASVVAAGLFGTTLILLGLDAEDRQFINMIRARLR
jgi:O-antigen/teichoic acid export membrane protein